MGAVHKMMDMAFGEEITTYGEEDIVTAMSYERYTRAIGQSKQKTSVGMDGWNSYILSRMGEKVKVMYWECIVEAMKTGVYPTEWSSWYAMLAGKKGEDPAELARRRDLWVVCHGQKIVMRMIFPEYTAASDRGVPASQAGFEKNRGAPEQSMTMRNIQDHAAQTGGDIYVLYIDWATFFMGIVKEVQTETEKRMGVHPDVSQVVVALHTEVKGAYETEYGLSGSFNVANGTGQGCINGAVRAKVILARNIATEGGGYEITPGKRNGRRIVVPNLSYADDMVWISSTAVGMQLTLDTCVMAAVVLNMEVKIKGKTKTAYAATRWTREKKGGAMRQEDIEVDLRMANGTAEGTKVPKLDKEDAYTYLGTIMEVMWHGSSESTRRKVVKACKGVIAAISRVPLQTPE